VICVHSIVHNFQKSQKTTLNVKTLKKAIYGT